MTKSEEFRVDIRCTKSGVTYIDAKFDDIQLIKVKNLLMFIVKYASRHSQSNKTYSHQFNKKCSIEMLY